MTTTEFNRRRFLTVAAGAGGLAATLAACGSDKPDAGSANSTTAGNSTTSAPVTAGSEATASASNGGASTAVPAHVPYNGVKPDLPAGDHGVPAGFYHYPANPPTFDSGSIGSGSSISIMLEGAAAKTPHDKNPWWQALEKAMDVKLTFNNVLSTYYTEKLQTAIAGGNLADFTQIPNGGVPGSGVPGLPDVLDKMFTDLTPYLAGDAIKQYPGLASIPTDTWTKICTINGKIWGIAQPRPAASPIVNFLQSTLTAAGISSVDLRDGDDLTALFRELTDPKGGRYAMSQVPTDWLLPLIMEMMDGPNNWAVANGEFSSWYTSEQMPDALDVVAKLWKAGYIHPDAFSGTGWFAMFLGGKLGLYSQHFPGWTGSATSAPNDTVGVLRLPKWGGGGDAPQYLTVPGYADPVGIKKTADEKRITELLRVANYIAAPFGTKEYLLVDAGVAGHDYVLNGADPVAQQTNDSIGLSYIGTQSSINLYANGQKDIIDAEHQFLVETLPTAVDDPSLGLYSETDASKGAVARKTLHAVQDDVIQGRKSISDYKTAAAAWKSSVGDQTAKEYAEAYAKSH